jgi:hypothetical protein
MIIIALGDHRVNRIFDELRQGIRDETPADRLQTVLQ